MGHVTMRTSVKPRWSAASARLRASPECPQITGSARTTMTSRRRNAPLPGALLGNAAIIESPVVSISCADLWCWLELVRAQRPVDASRVVVRRTAVGWCVPHAAGLGPSCD